MLSRRHFLAVGAATLVGGWAVEPAPADAAAKAIPHKLLPHRHHRVRPERSVHLYNVHTGESLRSVYWIGGHYQPTEMHRLAHLLRDHYTNAVHPIDRRTIDLLHALHRRIGGNKPFLVISGYRTPATNAMLAAAGEGVATHSLHMRGMAVDLRMEGHSVRRMGRAARSLRMGGVGIYPSSNFIHVDSGPIRYW